ncbi:hypothetical protein U9M48_016732 [Paspalum notatum var. saurae]|uniref:Uncharacterized protein n=1 Tax=Paspalum notatum var. saurae TaxID=547442 RepID=A0AAQ3T7Q8_PASNO
MATPLPPRNRKPPNVIDMQDDVQTPHQAIDDDFTNSTPTTNEILTKSRNRNNQEHANLFST